jgi:hypothetical protein
MMLDLLGETVGLLIIVSLIGWAIYVATGRDR